MSLEARLRAANSVSRGVASVGPNKHPDADADRISLLLVEDSDADADTVTHFLSQDDGPSFRFERQDTVAKARAYLTTNCPDVILLDLTLPDSAGLVTVQQVHDAAPDVPIVVLTGIDSESIGRGAIQSHAQDYLVKGRVDQALLVRTIHHAIERHRLQEALRRNEGQLRHLVSRLRDANTRLEELVNLDPLTELPNRRALEQALATELKRAKRGGSPLAALLLDCDDFKRINDSLGHAAGDAVLQQIAHRIRDAIRGTDHVARLGGDEFMILMPDASLWESLRFAERIRLAVCSTPVINAPEPVTITVSTGACRIPYSSSSVEEVLALTRLGLQRSKASGKNRVSTNAGQTTGARIEEHTKVVEQLSKEDAFSVVSQRIVRLSDESIVGYELLSRSSVAGFENPNDFFRVCLERNMLTLVDLACLRNAVAAADNFEGIATVHVNIFPSTILSTPAEALLRLFRQASKSTTFCLEISEQQLICDPRELRYKLDALRESGVQIALDDVGFGRTSLELLILLEPNVVKIDGEFVRAASRNTSQQGALHRLARIIETLRADLVAEGIETDEHLAVVKDTGVAYGQGFVWGRPKAVQAVS